MKVKLAKSKISTDLHKKNSDKYHYLHYTSSHPNHTKWSSVYSQPLRVKMICSEEKDFKQHIHKMRSWFQKRAYPNKVLDEKLVKVWFSNKAKTCSKRCKGIPFAIMYHPILQALKDIIERNLNWMCILDNEVQILFSPGPMV